QANALSSVRQSIQSKHPGRRVSVKNPQLAAAMRQIARDIPLITVRHPTRSDARFLFSLSRGEMVLAKVNGVEQALVYNTSASTTGQILFHHHTDARSGKEKRKISFSADTLLGKSAARKITVDYLGRIRWAKD